MKKRILSIGLGYSRTKVTDFVRFIDWIGIRFLIHWAMLIGLGFVIGFVTGGKYWFAKGYREGLDKNPGTVFVEGFQQRFDAELEKSK